MLDGNAVAGTLSEIYGDDMTTVLAECGSCGQVDHVGGLVAYVHAPGIVLRCTSCSTVMLRIVQTPKALASTCARSGSRLRLDLPGPRRPDRGSAGAAPASSHTARPRLVVPPRLGGGTGTFPASLAPQVITAITTGAQLIITRDLIAAVLATGSGGDLGRVGTLLGGDDRPQRDLERAPASMQGQQQSMLLGAIVERHTNSVLLDRIIAIDLKRFETPEFQDLLRRAMNAMGRMMGVTGSAHRPRAQPLPHHRRRRRALHPAADPARACARRLRPDVARERREQPTDVQLLAIDDAERAEAQLHLRSLHQPGVREGAARRSRWLRTCAPFTSVFPTNGSRSLPPTSVSAPATRS